jgi:hypothetical protein
VHELTVTRDGPSTFVVEIEGDDRTTRHLVEVPSGLLTDLGLADDDAELLVRESIEFLLEREPQISIMTEFPLDVIGQYFPEYRDEIEGRVS